MLVGMNGQQMLNAGTHKVCQCGGTIIPIDVECCRACRDQAQRAARSNPPVPPASRPRSTPRRRGKPSSGSLLRIGDAVIDDHNAGGLADLPDRSAMFGAAGVAVPQGSMVAAAPGVIIREKGSDLLAWRNAVHRSFMAFAGRPGWSNPDCPIRVHVVLTMPKPERWGIVASQTRPAVPDQPFLPRVAPSTRPDLDKLVRAIGDALAPKHKPRAYTDDGRIVEFLTAKTFPYPEHIHPWALGVPGVVIMVCPLDVPALFPPTTLTDPGPRPQALIDAVDEELLASQVPLPTLKAG